MKDLLNTKHFYIFENKKFKIFKTMFESLFFTNSNKNYKSFAFKYGGKNKLSVLKIKIFYINFLKLTKKMSDNALKDRVKKFLQVERISKTEFGEIADVSAMYVNSLKKNMSFEILKKLYKINPSVSLKWLLWGEGTMYETGDKNEKKLAEENAILRDKVSMLQKIVDLYERNENGQKNK